MGRIKTQQIKSKGNEIYDKFGDKFTKDFQKNKEVITKVADINSKKIKNILAGYLVKKVKQN